MNNDNKPSWDGEYMDPPSMDNAMPGGGGTFPPNTGYPPPPDGGAFPFQQQQQFNPYDGAGHPAPMIGSGVPSSAGAPQLSMNAGSSGNNNANSLRIESSVDIATVEAHLVNFWNEMKTEVQNLDPLVTDFKTHSDLPLARIKRIMKADEDVRMVSAEAPVMFARACRMFILEITKRAWLEAEDSKRRTLQKEDVHAAILKTDIYDFLVDVVDGTIEEEQRQMKLEQKRKQQAEAAAKRLSETGGDGTGATASGSFPQL